MFEPLSPELSGAIALLVLIACAWGIWRGRETSRKVLLFFLGLFVFAVIGSYISYAMTHAPAGPLGTVGGVSLMLALGLLGPAFFTNRVAAVALSAAICGFWVFAGTGTFVYGICVLFATCI